MNKKINMPVSLGNRPIKNQITIFSECSGNDGTQDVLKNTISGYICDLDWLKDQNFSDGFLLPGRGISKTELNDFITSTDMLLSGGYPEEIWINGEEQTDICLFWPGEDYSVCESASRFIILSEEMDLLVQDNTLLYVDNMEPNKFFRTRIGPIIDHYPEMIRSFVFEGSDGIGFFEFKEGSFVCSKYPGRKAKMGVVDRSELFKAIYKASYSIGESKVDLVPHAFFAALDKGFYKSVKLSDYDKLSAIAEHNFIVPVTESFSNEKGAAPGREFSNRIHLFFKEGRKDQYCDIAIPEFDQFRFYENAVSRLMRESSDAANALVDRLKHIALSDALTGLPNRRALEEQMSSVFKMARRYGQDVSIVFCDIDFFKVINDELGHQAGDEALVGFADLISKSIRDSDMVARWGGEEFIILLPHTNLDGARGLAEKCRKKLEVAEYDGLVRGLEMTASFGVAMVNTKLAETQALEDVVQRADQALYEAKRTGRNKVVVA